MDFLCIGASGFSIHITALPHKRQGVSTERPLDYFDDQVQVRPVYIRDRH